MSREDENEWLYTMFGLWKYIKSDKIDKISICDLILKMIKSWNVKNH